MNRIIMHLDLDCFFASVEMRDNPKLEKKPVIIGADPKNGYGRGVVSTCNYKAREFGLHSAMPISKAYSLCPHGVYLRPSHEKYSAASRKVMQIINSYSESFQQMGIDEAYLEVTDICEDYTEARDLAKGIQNHIRESIGVTLSIGIAPTKSIAKIASDHKKPRGITVVKPEFIHQFLYNMKITRIPGIGKKSRVHYLKNGFRKIGDFIDCPKQKLISLFGKHGKWIYRVIHGLDQREVKEFNQFRKSISKERTFY